MADGLAGRLNVSQEEFLHNLDAGQHGCVFYFSKEELREIHFYFVKSGLENNWGVVYATATESVDEVRQSMQKYGISVQNYEKQSGDGTLIILRGEELYGDARNPDMEKWLHSAKSVSEMFVSQGKRGVRVAADLSSHFLSCGLISQWHDLEYALEKKIPFPMTVLCAYDARIPQLLESDVLKYYDRINAENKEFVDAHSFSIYAHKNKSIIFKI
ncbi:MAG: MEDS domain-containing protein [Thermoproteota archaeon]|nr:MEDS domain-containing protein [Thermoproteota archaeon]